MGVDVQKVWSGGIHNESLDASVLRLRKAGGYADQSTVIVCPTLGMVHCRVVQSWMNLAKPMNQRIYGPIFIRGMEVGAAYEAALDIIFGNPVLAAAKYVLTIEDDNIPPPDGLLRLLESIEGKVDDTKYDSVCGLYWTKGEAGQPMIYGNPSEPINFRPQLPRPDTVQECHGTGMGFALLRMSMLKSDKIARPFFVTKQDAGGTYTQDLYFYEKARKAGFRIASDTRVKVGHYDIGSDIIW